MLDHVRRSTEYCILSVISHVVSKLEAAESDVLGFEEVSDTFVQAYTALAQRLKTIADEMEEQYTEGLPNIVVD